MKFKFWSKLFVLLTFVILFACARQTTVKPSTVPTRYFIHGDITNLVAGTYGNQISPFTTDSITNFADYHLSNMVMFSERIKSEQVKQINSQEELEQQNSTERNARSLRLLDRYQFYATEEDHYTFEAKNIPTQDDYPYLLFRKSNSDEYHLKELKFTNRSLGYSIKKLHHYSINEDQSLFSILFEIDDPVYGPTLVAMYFAKNFRPTRMFRQLSKDYAFIFGNGIAIGWEKPIRFEICGSRSLSQREVIEDAIQSWDFGTTPGMIGSLPYTVEVNQTPPPFSDVNRSCIFLTENYRFENQERTLTLGVTFPIVNFTSQEIVGSSAFISLSAHEFLPQRLPATITHEVGHMLGLGHEFQRDASGAAIYPSIMGYENISNLTPRDREAITALYPR